MVSVWWNTHASSTTAAWFQPDLVEDDDDFINDERKIISQGWTAEECYTMGRVKGHRKGELGNASNS